MPRPPILLVIAIATTGCLATGAGAGDDPAVESGKLAFADGSPDAGNALRTANTASAAAMRQGAGLTASAASNRVARRAGPDGVEGTADDRPFYTLAELDAVRDVGVGSINRLAAYGRAHRELFGAALH